MLWNSFFITNMVFLFKFRRRLFLRALSTISHHWSRQLLDAKRVTRYHLSPWCSSSLTQKSFGDSFIPRFDQLYLRNARKMEIKYSGKWIQQKLCQIFQDFTWMLLCPIDTFPSALGYYFSNKEYVCVPCYSTKAFIVPEMSRCDNVRKEIIMIIPKLDVHCKNVFSIYR